MTNGERLQLVRELAEIQVAVPAVMVTFDRAAKELKIAQDRVDEIEAMLATDTASRSPAADLGP